MIWSGHQMIWYGTLAQAMKAIHASCDINQLLKCVVSRLRIIAKAGNLSYISTIMSYFFEVGEMRDQKEFADIMRLNFTKKEQRKIMTYAEQLRFEGKAEGRVEGRVEGRTEATRDMAIKLLQRNSAPDVVASVTDLSLAKILKLKKKIAVRKK